MTDLLSRTDPQNPWPPHQPAAAGPAGPGGPVPPWTPGPPASSGPGRHRGGRRLAVAAGALVLVLGGGVAGGVIGAHTDQSAAPTASAAANATNVSTSSATLASVAARTSPSVVTIMVQVPGGTVEGSGVIVDDQGRIITNNHVVEQAAGGATVQLSDGRSLPAQILRTDPSHDLALLQVDSSGLTPATLGDSSTVQVGDTVLAFGSPLGLSGTVTSGIVSALDRDAQDLNLSGLIQTDAPINSGNSGGPLVDAAGQVIAINVANASTSQGGGSIGIGFAIPINSARAILS
ncbi:putative serine protease PepD [Asanoa hainanensis]|uniref:Putative serine protease PepD n=1 Tax=Asanoa hainanensis TaxID=560556 RepID=A0A239NTA5_9ACTN|nr:trypsin-like peptidase domain-containing protein [Asanoa hainanensis]SNT57932.1 putative serine protease PepD [Asanoa hainanensis]